MMIIIMTINRMSVGYFNPSYSFGVAKTKSLWGNLSDNLEFGTGSLVSSSGDLLCVLDDRI